MAKINPKDRVKFIKRITTTTSARNKKLQDYKKQFAKRASDYRKNAKFNDPSNVKFRTIPKNGKIKPDKKKFEALLFETKENYKGGQVSFYSTNVKSFKIKESNLLVQFLDNSIYAYYGAGKLFQNFLQAGSKGKGVWRNLIRKNITYAKIS